MASVGSGIAARLFACVGLAAAALAAIAGGAAQAERLGPFLYLEDAPKVLSLVDTIGDSADFELGEALDRYPAVTTLVLNAVEGDLAGAMRLATVVRERGLMTYVPRGARCHTACALVFLAAEHRLVEGELAVNRPEASESALRRAEGLFDQYEETGFIRRIMLITPPDSLYVFSESDITQLALNRLPDGLGGEDEVTPPVGPDPFTPDERVVAPQPADYGWRVAVYAGLDFYGNDIWSGEVADEPQCRERCLSYGSCVAYTFNAAADYCFVKDRIDVLAPYSDAYGGQIIGPSLPEAPTYSFGGIDPTQDVTPRTVYQDPNYSVVSTRNENDCLIACIRAEGCAAYSYNSGQRQCALKASADWPDVARGWNSGLKQSRTYRPMVVVEVSR